MFQKFISNSFLIFFFLFLQVNKVQGDELALCEVLQTSFFGSAPVQVQCGEGPEGVGWISNNARIQQIALKLRDRDTGQERMLFHDTRADAQTGGFHKTFVNYSKDYYLPIGLFIPRGCNSNRINILPPSVLEFLERFRIEFELDYKKFLQEDRECALLNENDTNWRSGVPGIRENEDILHVQYALQPSTSIYYDKEGKERKGFLSTFYVQSSRDDFYCESLEDPFVLSPTNTRCDSKKTVPICIGKFAWCSSSNAREHFEFLKYGCKALEDRSCPSLTDCILGEDSFYSSEEYVEKTGISIGVTQRFYHFDQENNKSSQSGSGDR